MRYISGLAIVMVGSFRGSDHLVDCDPPVEILTDCVCNASLFWLRSGSLFVPNYWIE
jgi:hypothetical protein